MLNFKMSQFLLVCFLLLFFWMSPYVLAPNPIHYSRCNPTGLFEAAKEFFKSQKYSQIKMSTEKMINFYASKAADARIDGKDKEWIVSQRVVEVLFAYLDILKKIYPYVRRDYDKSVEEYSNARRARDTKKRVNDYRTDEYNQIIKKYERIKADMEWHAALMERIKKDRHFIQKTIDGHYTLSEMGFEIIMRDAKCDYKDAFKKLRKEKFDIWKAKAEKKIEKYENAKTLDSVRLLSSPIFGQNLSDHNILSSDSNTFYTASPSSQSSAQSSPRNDYTVPSQSIRNPFKHRNNDNLYEEISDSSRDLEEIDKSTESIRNTQQNKGDIPQNKMSTQSIRKSNMGSKINPEMKMGEPIFGAEKYGTQSIREPKNNMPPPSSHATNLENKNDRTETFRGVEEGRKKSIRDSKSIKENQDKDRSERPIQKYDIKEKETSSIRNDAIFRAFSSSDMNALAQPDGWLENTVINAYLELLTRDRDNVRFVPSDVIIIFLREKMIRSDWLQYQIGKGSSELVQLWFIPAHLNGDHWALAVFDVQKNSIVFYNSIITVKETEEIKEFREALFKFFNNLYGHLNYGNLNMNQVKWINRINIPRQTNSWDCGVFLLMYADEIIRSNNISTIFTFTQNFIPEYRARIHRELMANQLESSNNQGDPTASIRPTSKPNTNDSIKIVAKDVIASPPASIRIAGSEKIVPIRTNSNADSIRKRQNIIRHDSGEETKLSTIPEDFEFNPSKSIRPAFSKNENVIEPSVSIRPSASSKLGLLKVG